MDNHIIERKAVVKFLRIFLDDTLSWSPHITQLCTKLSQDNALLKMASHFFNNLQLIVASLLLFYSHLIYSI